MTSSMMSIVKRSLVEVRASMKHGRARTHTDERGKNDLSARTDRCLVADVVLCVGAEASAELRFINFAIELKTFLCATSRGRV